VCSNYVFNAKFLFDFPTQILYQLLGSVTLEGTVLKI
jgi:hypothetical protein